MSANYEVADPAQIPLDAPSAAVIPSEGVRMNGEPRMIELVIVTKDDHDEPIDPPRLLLDDKLYRPEPDPNGWRYVIPSITEDR